MSLGNVLSAKAPNEKIPFIADADLELYQKYRDAAFEVQVGIHELLGHGTGKLLQETEPGKFNFDPKSPPISPITNKPVTTYYKPGQTWGSVFGGIAASYEEVRTPSPDTARPNLTLLQCRAETTVGYPFSWSSRLRTFSVSCC